jgi:predicted nucleic acid-binding protein
MIGPSKPRLFLDSNVIMCGFMARRGLDKAVLSICASRICKLVLAESVRVEVERNLLPLSEGFLPDDPENPLSAYRYFLQLSAAELVAKPDGETVRSNFGLIRHLADLPVLLSAIAAKPDWLLTNNTKHFTPEVARRTGLRIATPHQFFATISSVILT